jgi:hypothetical protein
MQPEIGRQFVTHPSFNKAVKLMRAIFDGIRIRETAESEVTAGRGGKIPLDRRSEVAE